MHLLLIERFASDQTPIAKQLLEVGLRLDYARCASEARDHLAAQRHDLVLIEIAPQVRWIQTLLAERPSGARIPLIALVPEKTLTGSGLALASRADDWVTTPVAMPELMARIHAVLGCGRGARSGTYRAGELVVGPVAGQASFAGVPLILSRRESAALTHLVRAAPHPVPRQTLEATVYGLGAAITSNAIEAVLSRLRRTLKRAGCPARVVALRGIGWRLTIPDHEGGPHR